MSTSPLSRIVNRQRRKGFVQVDNRAARDHRLSYKARGVLTYLLSHTAEWRETADSLAEKGQAEGVKEGRDSIRAALRELEAFGYLVRVPMNMPNGLRSVDWHVSDDPADLQGIEKPQVKPRTGEPAPVEPPPRTGEPTSVQAAPLEDHSQEDQPTHPSRGSDQLVDARETDEAIARRVNDAHGPAQSVRRAREAAGWTCSHSTWSDANCAAAIQACVDADKHRGTAWDLLLDLATEEGARSPKFLLGDWDRLTRQYAERRASEALERQRRQNVANLRRQIDTHERQTASIEQEVLDWVSQRSEAWALAMAEAERQLGSVWKYTPLKAQHQLALRIARAAQEVDA